MQMAYLDTRRGPSVSSMAAVVAVHAAAGAALIFGLTVSGIVEKPEILTGITVRPSPPPPSPPPPETDTRSSARDDVIVAPRPPIIPPAQPPVVETTDFIPPPLPPAMPGVGEQITPLPTPLPSFTAVAARPRNDPLGWVNTDDYKSNWIRQEMTGRARFRLDISAEGRVTGCTITASSGHPELDAATCALVSRRARFQPGRDANGQAVASSYANAIDWRLPR